MGRDRGGQHQLPGAAVAAPYRRVVLFTGEGSHQLTAQETSQFGRRGLKPIVFVLNNSGYLIERLLCRNPEFAYNDIAQWHYADLPKALGCDDWLLLALRHAENSIKPSRPRLRAIEVRTSRS